MVESSSSLHVVREVSPIVQFCSFCFLAKALSETADLSVKFGSLSIAVWVIWGLVPFVPEPH